MEPTNKSEAIDCDTPVTIIVKRRPKPGCVDEFEKVMSGTTKDAMAFQGHLGVNIIKPTFPGDYYRIVFKFDSMRNYLAWEGSEIREQWLQRYAEVGASEQEVEILNGLETWFTLPGGEAVVPPAKYKMLLIVWISIFPLSVLLYYCLTPFLGALPVYLQIAVTSLTLVSLMTYAVMPFMAKLFHRWLHCGKNT